MARSAYSTCVACLKLVVFIPVMVVLSTVFVVAIPVKFGSAYSGSSYCALP